MSAHEGTQHPISVYLWIWLLLFVLSTFSYLVDYFHLQGMLRWTLIIVFMLLKAGFIVAIFMHMKWERLALEARDPRAAAVPAGPDPPDGDRRRLHVPHAHVRPERVPRRAAGQCSGRRASHGRPRSGGRPARTPSRPTTHPRRSAPTRRPSAPAARSTSRARSRSTRRPASWSRATWRRRCAACSTTCAPSRSPRAATCRTS